MIVAVAGGKGGVGKSTLALNLAYELDAVLVDADLTMADLPVSSGPDFHDVLAGQVDPVTAVRTGGLIDVLPCGRSLAEARTVEMTRVPESINDIACAFGDVVVDTPAGMAADAGLPLSVADGCILVTTGDRAAIADTVRTRELARELEAGLVRVVLNEAGSDPPITRVRTVFGAPVVAVERSETVGTGQAQGLPVGSIAPKAGIREPFEQLAVAVQSCKS